MKEKLIITNTQFNKLKQESQQAVNDIMFNLGGFIKNKRVEKNISIRDLNGLSRVSTAVVSDIENGVSLPRIEILVRLALAMDIPLNELFANFVSQSYQVVPIEKQQQTLSSMLQMTGLTRIEANEVLEFIEFKKSRKQK